MTRTSVSEICNHRVAITPDGRITRFPHTQKQPVILGDPLFAGLASRALPALLLEQRRRLQDLHREHEGLSDLINGVILYEEMVALANPLDNLDVSIALTERIVSRLAAEITLRASS